MSAKKGPIRGSEQNPLCDSMRLVANMASNKQAKIDELDLMHRANDQVGLVAGRSECQGRRDFWHA